MNEDIKKEFIHLKIHTQYSICEGALRTLDLAKYCKTNKIKAVGLCDSNNLCGALEFSESIAKSKTQPIIGTQINIQHKDNRGKIPLFAKNLEGYKNLIKLSSKSFLGIKENEEPHCTIEDLKDNVTIESLAEDINIKKSFLLKLKKNINKEICTNSSSIKTNKISDKLNLLHFFNPIYFYYNRIIASNAHPLLILNIPNFRSLK